MYFYVYERYKQMRMPFMRQTQDDNMLTGRGAYHSKIKDTRQF